MAPDQVFCGWRGRDRTCDLLIQSQAFCQLNYPPLSAPSVLRNGCESDPGRDCQTPTRPRTVSGAMGSLIKKRRKRMRKKKHKKLLKKTRWQRRQQGR